MKKLLLILILILCIGQAVFAQTGDTGGPFVDVETETVCWSNGGTDSTIYHVWLYVVGQTDPVDLGYRNAAGTVVTVSGGTLTVGPCAGDGGAAGPDYSYSILELCDDGTPFYRLIRYNDDDNGTAISTLATDWTSYTITGTVTSGPCVTTAAATITRVSSTTTGTVAVNASSFEICNVGTSNGTVTVNAVDTNLVPGECYRYAAYVDPVTRIYRRAPAITFDATGTTFIIVRAD